LAFHSGREADHSLTSVWCRGQGMGGTAPPLPNTPSWRSAQLEGAQG
jgi:hypothetical protein